jgi:hypothetical protein
MTAVSPDPPNVVKGTIGPQSLQATKEATSKRPSRAVSWYGRLLIFSMLLVAAGWEIFRWILAVIVFD